MNAMEASGAYGVLIEPATLRIKRRLPGPIERVWSYLTDSDLRRQWLASGDMDLTQGAPFSLTWRNDELTDPPGTRPDGFGTEHTMESTILEVETPNRLVFAWGGGDVAFDLKQEADDVILTVTHRRISDRANTVMVGAGWHMHLDILTGLIMGEKTEPFWDGWQKLRAEYDRRVPA
jgi:uncharacterized protein YndB with AHSA1/START domain